MTTLKVKLVLEAVICDHCDTYFGVPLWLSGHPFHCPLGHRNEGREFETEPDTPNVAPPEGIWEVLTGAAAEELELGGDAGSVVACIREMLAEEGHVVVQVPRVAHKGPRDTDASMYAAAAGRLERGYGIGGSNLTRAVATLLSSVAEAAAR
ncbi:MULTISPECIES: hypothetical protein [Mycobacteroides]|nr:MULTISPECIES: hypothetical protein [Mycobacteroides]SKN58693.1 Uncharacterised protein [Mycobacteroides abscessus subsp. massiliense]SKR65250.1 Uncharacterised protein [Mycobacteroides abscessus subsp. abscessus]SLH53300.1 Uncharacterised protein [Mycobacteroides abscessus subsp. massiliense]